MSCGPDTRHLDIQVGPSHADPAYTFTDASYLPTICGPQLDLYQLQQTLLAALQPFLHAAVPLLRRRHFPASATASSSAAHAHASAATPTLGSGTTTAIASSVASPAGAPPSPPNLASGIAVGNTATTPAATPTPASTAASAAGVGSGGGGVEVEVEDEEEDAAVAAMLEDPGSVGGLPPAELATACLRLLLKLQWAMHCRAQVRARPWKILASAHALELR